MTAVVGNLVPLQDHFRPPLSVRRHWHAFHNSWATYIASALNAALPPGYFAEPNVQFGIEIDVATYDERSVTQSGNGAAATATYAPPAPALVIPFSPPSETVEVLVYESGTGPTLTGAIELVSPANKDRPAHRDAFTAKCHSYLQAGAGLVIIDVVTARAADLHRELLERLMPTPPATPSDALYTAAYRPVEIDGKPQVEVWYERMAVGEPLPSLPLWLRGGLTLEVDLAGTYDRTCREQRLPVAT